MNRKIAGLAAACALAAFPGCSERKDHHATEYGVTVNAIPGLPDDFIKGADVSMLAQLEASGAVFRDTDGRQQDCLRILRAHGVNWVRLRLWNTPTLAAPLKLPDGWTVPAGDAAGGVNDLPRDVALAGRARALGMQVLLDLHYSDWWADPAKQMTPQAWAGYDLARLTTAVHDFTAEAVQALRAAGAGPDMVQLGNEVTNGMLWPLGRIDNRAPATYDGFVALLGAGAKAVRDVDPAIPLLVHLDAGGNNALYRRFFATLVDRGVDFDVIGLSYYPAWHGTLADLRANLDDVSQAFRKPVVIAETAYPWTTEDADRQPNSYDGVAGRTQGPALPTVQGQATFLRELMQAVAAVPDGRGRGIFYWEPDWIAVEGAGWYTEGGDGWDNQAMFAHDGTALASLDVFRAVSDERPFVAAAPVSVPAQGGISMKAGDPAPALPLAKVVFDDDGVRAVAVDWDRIDPAVWSTPGVHELLATVPGTALRVTLPVTVSLLVNSGFEDGLTGWSAGPAGAAGVAAENFHGGGHAFHWWDAGSVDLFVQQTVKLPAGAHHTLSVWAMGPANHAALTLYAACDGGPEATAAITLADWPNWVQTSLHGLSGECTVGVRSTTHAGDWGNLDDFALTEEVSASATAHP